MQLRQNITFRILFYTAILGNCGIVWGLWAAGACDALPALVLCVIFIPLYYVLSPKPHASKLARLGIALIAFSIGTYLGGVIGANLYGS